MPRGEWKVNGEVTPLSLDSAGDSRIYRIEKSGRLRGVEGEVGDVLTSLLVRPMLC